MMQSVGRVPRLEGTVEGGGSPHERHSTRRVQRPEGTLAQRAVQEAIEKSPHPTRISIQKNLSDSNFSTAGATNRVKFLPSSDCEASRRHRSSNIQLVEVQPGNNEFGYKFVPIGNK